MARMGLAAGLFCIFFHHSVVASTPSLGSYVPLNSTNQIIVKFKSNTRSNVFALSTQQRVNALTTTTPLTGVQVHYKRSLSNQAHVLQLSHPISIEVAHRYAEQMRNDNTVEYAEPDQLMFPTGLIPSDTSVSQQWHLTDPTTYPAASNFFNAWTLTTGTANTTIAVVDTGVLNHRDLSARLVGGNAAQSGRDFISLPYKAGDGDGRDMDPTDTGDWLYQTDYASGNFDGCTVRNSSWHGTHITGIAAALSNNAQGIAGGDWASNVLIVRALGKCGGYLSDISDAIRWSAGETIDGIPNPHPARIINLSLGAEGSCGETYQNAIDSANARGAVVVVAAGNAGINANRQRPANCQNVISVAALNKDGSRASFSNYGDTVDIAAAGVDILSTLDSGGNIPRNDNAYARYSGTSMAAPQVTSTISLMFAANPHFTDGSIPLETIPKLIEQRLKTASRPFTTQTPLDCTTTTCGAGMLDAYRAVQSVKTPPTLNITTSGNLEINNTILLNATTDALATDNMRYQWKQLEGSPVALTSTSTAQTQFISHTAGNLRFQVTVTSAIGLSTTQYIDINIAPTVTPNALCAATTLLNNQPLTGNWQANCTARSQGINYYARYYRVKLANPRLITINLNSEQDTFLTLTNESGSIISSNNDANNSRNSEIRYILPAGTYTLEASTNKPFTMGTFNIGYTLKLIPSCTPSPLKINQTLSALWVNGGCHATARTGAHYAKHATFTLTQTTKIQLTATSNQDSYLYLLTTDPIQGTPAVLAENNDGVSTKDAQITRTLPAGTYWVEATTYAPTQTGTVTITLARVP